jgi:hypothetical protein
MELEFEAKVVLRLEHKKEYKMPKHIATDINLLVGQALDKKMYLDAKELPNKDGSKVLSNVLIQGLVANVHASHQKGFRDSAEHLRWIISELEQGFIRITNVTEGEF